MLTLKKRIRVRGTEAGFTLIELLIVIIILAILAAIVVFAIGSTGTNAAASACRADAKSLETAVEAYKAQNNNAYPATPSSPADTTNWNQLLSTGASGAPYLRAQPATNHYTVWWDSNGAIWVGPSQASTAAYPATASGMNFDTTSGGACSVAK